MRIFKDAYILSKSCQPMKTKLSNQGKPFAPVKEDVRPTTNVLRNKGGLSRSPGVA